MTGPQVTGPGVASLPEAIRHAAAQVGLSTQGATLIRLGENQIWRLPDRVVARMARPGQESAAAKEVQVARWLRQSGIRSIEAVPVAQPVIVGGAPVTFWRELPPHRRTDLTTLGRTLRRLHALEPPDFLRPVEPFVRLTERLDDAHLTATDRRWMDAHLADLTRRWDEVAAHLTAGVLHGDAHTGNLVQCESDDEPVVLDLERFAVGPPEWDLVLTAVEHVTCGWISHSDYQDFVAAYGRDVVDSPSFELLLGIREFRMALFACQLAAATPAFQGQAAERIAGLRGRRGARPWTGWKVVP